MRNGDLTFRLPRIALAIAAGVQALMANPAIAGQAGFQPINSWGAERGANTKTTGDTLLVRAGLIRTRELYSDFVLRFEFRLTEPDSEGRAYVRSRFGYFEGERSYRIALTSAVAGKEGLGRVTADGLEMNEVSFNSISEVRPGEEWQECELRAERDTFSVSINGALVSTVAEVNEFTGYIALQSRRGGGIEFRRIQVRRLPSAREPFGQNACHRDEEGVSLPKLIKNVKPFYPQEEHAAGTQGVVQLEMVVDVSGTVDDVRVIKGVTTNLDEAAIGAVRKWRFAPGTKDGKPVAVIVTAEISFRLRQ